MLDGGFDLDKIINFRTDDPFEDFVAGLFMGDEEAAIELEPLDGSYPADLTAVEEERRKIRAAMKAAKEKDKQKGDTKK